MTYAEEGARGFFRGMIPPLITVNGGFKYNTFADVLRVSSLSGGTSGAFIALLSCPLELVKIQRQLEQVMLKNQMKAGQISETQLAQASSWRAVKQIVQRKGVLGLWSGVTCHSARDALGTGIYFGGYESMKRILSKEGTSSGPIIHFMSGGFCGILSWLIVFPVDAIKPIYKRIL
ncbi:hypothetical protein [Parasitella parasitica]|uniref:Mitochondrial carrier protein n=1 Tax=Parasitella parasitica TaxID=35722 RepID=A0A0B7NMN8_9FUNG|nr:hypothetical protein [Parasitella parasitica]